MLPHVIVTAARTPRSPIQTADPSAVESGMVMMRRTRIKPSIPIALLAVARTPATGLFAPEYASGAAKWNGTALILNANPTSTNPSAIMLRDVAPSAAHFAASTSN